MPKKISRIIYVCFLFSGISGLIYEVLWAKYLALIFGNTAYACSLVLATFMGGLSLGSFFLGRLSDRLKNPLAFFGWIEISIALYCSLTHLLFTSSKTFYIGLAQSLSLSPTALVLVKFLIGALIMLPPTTLMGGTLPLLAKFLINTLSVRGQTIARLYYINSFGAVLGTLLAGFFLIHRFGLAFTTTIAAAINLLIGIIILTLKDAPVLKRTFAAPETPLPDKIVQPQACFSQAVVVLSLAGIFLSGCVAMLYEVVWIRLLSTVFGGSTYSFSLMLAAFISGITIGAYLIARFMPQERHTLLAFGLCEVAIGASLLLSLPFYEKLPFIFIKLSEIFVRTPNTFILYMSVKFIIAFLIMLPPTIFMGMTLPLVSKIASCNLKTLGKKIGGVFAYNTAGNILGALVTGLLLISALGLKNTLEIGVAVNIALGLIVILADKSWTPRQKLSLALASCLLIAGYKLLAPDWNKTAFTAEIFRGKHIGRNLRELNRKLSNKNILYYQDGVDATVAVIEEEKNLLLYVNGKADASTTGDIPSQILCAQLPLILKPAAKDVMVIGLGSGITCGSALLSEIETLDLIEISSAVVDANFLFKLHNYDALNDPRLNLYIEDAKTFLQKTLKKYDIIISEPSNPWMSGIGSLFTDDYFKESLEHLKPGGLMVQWVQAYEIDDPTFEMVLRTFCSIFPQVQVWTTGVSDILLLGSKEPIKPDFIASEQVMARKEIRQDLARIELEGLYTLLNLQLASDAHLRRSISKQGPVNQDYFPKLSYQAPQGLYTKASPQATLELLDTRKIPLEKSGLLLAGYLKNHPFSSEDMKNLYQFLSKNTFRSQTLILPLVTRWHQSYPDSTEAIKAYIKHNRSDIDVSISLLEPLLTGQQSQDESLLYGNLQLTQFIMLGSYFFPELYTEIPEKIKTCIAAAQEEKGLLHIIYASVFMKMKDYAQAIEAYEEALRILKDPAQAKNEDIDFVQVLHLTALAYLESGQMDKAAEYAYEMLALDEGNTSAKKIIEAVNFFGQSPDSLRR